MILEHLNKDNLHHAYLVEGEREAILPEIFRFAESLGMKTSGNPDFCHISVDSFKIEDARNLKSAESEKSFSADSSAESSGRKIFIISANNFLIEAQSTLLKIFEEPIRNTHFFVVVPDRNVLLRTLISRFYVIRTDLSARVVLAEKMKKEAEEFILMPLKGRIDFIKNLLSESEDEEEGENGINSVRSKALEFLNALEFILSERRLGASDAWIFSHIFKVREFASQPGSSLKSLMESVALVLPRINR